MSWLSTIWICSLFLPVAGVRAGQRLQIPTLYEAGHFYAVPETVAGQRLRLLVDTGGAGGGGRYVINERAARRLGLKVMPCGVGDDQVDVVPVIPYRDGKSLPASVRPLCDAVALVSKRYGLDSGDDGVLGAGYLPGHVWTFDYPGARLWLEPASWRSDAGAHRAVLGFQVNRHGDLATGFPRIAIEVDAQPVDLLLDTGATAKPTVAGERASGTPTVHGIGVTSYITTSVFDRWHKAHPDWRVVADGDDLLTGKHAARLIEVPEIAVAGWKVGPVWFTERPDANFRKYMSQWMDRPIDGSLGANALDHFVMTLDYPGRVAWFACVQSCRAADSDRPPSIHSSIKSSR